MNIREIDDKIYRMNTAEQAHLLFYILGYAKTNQPFRRRFVKAISEHYEALS